MKHSNWKSWLAYTVICWEQNNVTAVNWNQNHHPFETFKIKPKIKLTFVVKSLPLIFLIVYIKNKQISLTFGDCLLWIYPDGFWLKQLSYFSLNDISISGNLNFRIWFFCLCVILLSLDVSQFLETCILQQDHTRLLWKGNCKATACWKRSNSESRQILHILGNMHQFVYTVGGATGYSMSFLVENNTATNTLLCTLI